MMVTVDDGRHGQDDAVAVVDDGVRGLVFNNVQVMSQVAVGLWRRGQTQQVKKR